MSDEGEVCEEGAFVLPTGGINPQMARRYEVRPKLCNSNATYTSLEERGIPSRPLDMQQRHFFYFALSTEFRPHVERDQIFRSSQKYKDLLPSLFLQWIAIKGVHLAGCDWQ